MRSCTLLEKNPVTTCRQPWSSYAVQTFAYCDRSFIESVTKAAAVFPCTTPPFNTDTIHPAWFEGQDFLYFKLHGLPGQSSWYSNNLTTAITARQIRRLDLRGTTVFVANCYLWHSDTPGGPAGRAPMLHALLGAGARAVVGGSGINYARARSVYGADVLGQAFRQLIGLGFSPRAAFRLGMLRVRLHRHNHHTAMIDVQSFRIFDNTHQEPELDGINVL